MWVIDISAISQGVSASKSRFVQDAIVFLFHQVQTLVHPTKRILGQLASRNVSNYLRLSTFFSSRGANSPLQQL